MCWGTFSYDPLGIRGIHLGGDSPSLDVETKIAYEKWLKEQEEGEKEGEEKED